MQNRKAFFTIIISAIAIFAAGSFAAGIFPDRKAIKPVRVQGNGRCLITIKYFYKTGDKETKLLKVPAKTRTQCAYWTSMMGKNLGNASVKRKEATYKWQSK